MPAFTESLERAQNRRVTGSLRKISSFEAWYARLRKGDGSMMKYLAVAFVLFGSSTPAWATWSVIALDARSGQVVIASATCVRQEAFPKREPSPARDLMDLQAVIVPGVGDRKSVV